MDAKSILQDTYDDREDDEDEADDSFTPGNLRKTKAEDGDDEVSDSPSFTESAALNLRNLSLNLRGLQSYKYRVSGKLGAGQVAHVGDIKVGNKRRNRWIQFKQTYGEAYYLM